MRPKFIAIICALFTLTCWTAAEECGEALMPGVNLYKQAKYAQAIASFQSVTDIHGSCESAWIYLGTAYAQLYIPGADDPENNRNADRAIRAYEKALEIEPSNIGAQKGIAYLKLQMKKFEEAKQAYKQAALADPSDPEMPYSIGVIDWTMVYQPRMEERAKLGMKPTEPLEDLSVCNLLRSKNAALVDEGIAQFRLALKLRPDYDDAMAYMNLMYREKADLQCDSKERRQKYLDIADRWVDRTLEVKRRKVEQGKICTENTNEPNPCYSPSDSKD